ncbi:probable AMP deaminase [Tanacetum coccineum]|uniref:Probable AMP deaminase n=1 Tax=Tanacetum coccineum TaxID=301880 RepID=A0ABQ5FW94_9ASTR
MHVRNHERKPTCCADTVGLFPVASATNFFTDMHHLLKIIAVGNVRSACYNRLGFLEEVMFYELLLVNADSEFLAQKGAPHRDFYNIRKVDTHVHYSACMNQKHLLRFIKSKLRKEPDEVLIFCDGQYLTLKEVLESLDLTGKKEHYVIRMFWEILKNSSLEDRHKFFNVGIGIGDGLGVVRTVNHLANGGDSATSGLTPQAMERGMLSLIMDGRDSKVARGSSLFGSSAIEYVLARALRRSGNHLQASMPVSHEGH